MRPMRPKSFISHVVASICAAQFLFPAISFAGWGENMRLTYRRFEMYPRVAARNDTVLENSQQVLTLAQMRDQLVPKLVSAQLKAKY